MQYYAMPWSEFHKNTTHLKSACRVVKGIEILTFWTLWKCGYWNGISKEWNCESLKKDTSWLKWLMMTSILNEEPSPFIADKWSVQAQTLWWLKHLQWHYCILLENEVLQVKLVIITIMPQFQSIVTILIFQAHSLGLWTHQTCQDIKQLEENCLVFHAQLIIMLWYFSFCF